MPLVAGLAALPAQAQRQRAVPALDHGAQVLAFATCRIDRDGRVGEILAGTEGAAGPGQNDAAHAGVAGRRVQLASQALVHLAGEAVQGGRTVERQRPDAACLRDENGGIWHEA